MTENLPALKQDTALASALPPLPKPETDDWIPVVAKMSWLANEVASTEFVPQALRDNVPATLGALLRGRELGLAPMASLANINMIRGKACLPAELMRALVYQAGHEIVFVESTAHVCKIKGRRRDSNQWTEVTWTMEQANYAGLTVQREGKGPNGWGKYPRAMLQARATSELCRMLFADVVAGLASTEEMDDFTDDTEPGNDPAPAADSGAVTRRARKTTKTTRPRVATVTAAPVAADPVPVAPDIPLPPPQTPDPSTPAGLGDGAGSVVDDVIEAAIVDEAGSDLPAAGDAAAADPAPVQDVATPAAASQAQNRMLFARFKELGVTDAAERHHVLGALAGRPIESQSELTKTDAKHVLDALSGVEDRDGLESVIQSASAKGSEK